MARKLSVADTLSELLSAVENVTALESIKAQMKNAYPPGACNAEDAWRDFDALSATRKRELDAAIQKARKQLGFVD